uniref:Microtubule associated tyrosine carboxypeptidase 2 n=1 Tax=Rhinopithecus roxellana TaxID=61622 RepID=A0A2K6PSV7_RHIRO
MVATGWARRSGLHPASRPLRGAQEALAKNLRREERNRPLFLSSLVIKKLHWPEQELAKKSILNAEDSLIIDSKRSISHLSSGVLKDIFTTGTSSYNVLLQSKEEKKYHSQKQSSSTYSKRCRKPSKSPNTSRSKDPRRMKALVPVTSSGTWYCLERRPASSVSSPVKFTHDISVTGNGIVLPPKPKSKVKWCHFSTLPKPKPQPQLSRSFEKGDDFSGKKFCILTAIKPINLEKEKLRFFKSDYTYNPQFEYANPALPSALAKHSHASDRFLKQVKCRFNSGSSFIYILKYSNYFYVMVNSHSFLVNM